MSREKAGGSSISYKLGLTSFNNPLAQLIHKYKEVEKCDRVYRDIRSILSFTSQPELSRLQSLVLDQEGGEELEEVLHHVERQLKELENKLSLATVHEFVSSSSTTISEETFEEREVKEILERYSERQGERNRLYRRFSDDARQLCSIMDTLRGGEKVETVVIPDLDGDFDQLSRSLAGVKSNFEKFLLIKCSKWVLQELKGKLQLIEAVERKVTDHQFSGTQV